MTHENSLLGPAAYSAQCTFRTPSPHQMFAYSTDGTDRRPFTFSPPIAVDQTLTFPADMPSHEAIETLRRALHVRPGETVSDAKVRVALRMICEDAHRHGLRAEQLLILFKQLWRTLPEVQPEPYDRPRGELLQHVITMCIREYYAPSTPQNAGAGSRSSRTGSVTDRRMPDGRMPGGRIPDGHLQDGRLHP